MKTRCLLLFLSLGSVCLPVLADRGGDDRDKGVPFDRLQEQIEKLRQRIQTLETGRPAGQTCLAGQFVTGFTSTGTILCATPAAETPTTPPPPPPIPASFQLTLQQLFNQFAGQGLPIPFSTPQTSNFGIATITTQAVSYDLAIGAVQIVQTSASTATIQIIIPSFALNSNISVTTLGVTNSGTIALSSSATVTISVAVVTSATGARSLDHVTGIDFAPGQISLTGNDLGIVSILQPLIASSPVFSQAVASAAEQAIALAITQSNLLVAAGSF